MYCWYADKLLDEFFYHFVFIFDEFAIIWTIECSVMSNYCSMFNNFLYIVYNLLDIVYKIGTYPTKKTCYLKT